MLGIRSESDKDQSKSLLPFRGITRKIGLHFAAKILPDTPMVLTVSDGCRTVSVTGETPQNAINAPLTREVAERNLSKLGGTPYAPEALDLNLADGLMVPISHLNDLRRRAIAAWETQDPPVKHRFCAYAPQKPTERRQTLRSARFYLPEQITPAAREYFDRIFLPLGKETPDADGVILPPVIFERDLSRVLQMLKTARANGVRYALVGNLGHLSIVKQAGLIPMGDFRLNVTNEETVCALEALGIPSTILSAELTLPQARDIGGNTALTVYGRIPLMTLEKCVGKEVGGCNACHENRVTIKDRRGIVFPVLREWEHRSVIYNSLPTSMSDRRDSLLRAGITSQHFIFSIETPREVDEVIDAFLHARPLKGQVRRI